MSGLMTALSVIAMLAVAAVLVTGLYNMARAGSPNRSQALMRLRIYLQIVAVVVMMGGLWIMSG